MTPTTVRVALNPGPAHEQAQNADQQHNKGVTGDSHEQAAGSISVQNDQYNISVTSKQPAKDATRTAKTGANYQGGRFVRDADGSETYEGGKITQVAGSGDGTGSPTGATALDTGTSTVDPGTDEPDSDSSGFGGDASAGFGIGGVGDGTGGVAAATAGFSVGGGTGGAATTTGGAGAGGGGTGGAATGGAATGGATSEPAAAAGQARELVQTSIKDPQAPPPQL